MALPPLSQASPLGPRAFWQTVANRDGLLTGKVSVPLGLVLFGNRANRDGLLTGKAGRPAWPRAFWKTGKPSDGLLTGKRKRPACPAFCVSASESRLNLQTGEDINHRSTAFADQKRKAEDLSQPHLCYRCMLATDNAKLFDLSNQ